MKAIIASGGKQYMVSKGDKVMLESTKQDKLTLEPLMVFDDRSFKVGEPTVKGAKVEAKLIETVRADKVTSIRYKAKKRVHKTRGHRQKLDQFEITSVKTS